MQWISPAAATEFPDDEQYVEGVISDSCLCVSECFSAAAEPVDREDMETPQLIVSLEKPFRIIASKGNSSGVLGYSDDEVRGQPLEIFHGPGTRCFLLQCAIENASLAETTRIDLVLCDKWGRSRAVDATFSPFTGGDGITLGCLVSFDATEAIALAEAFDDALNPGPKAIVSAEHPHMVEMVNENLTKFLGFSHNQSAGRGLVGLVCSPRTPPARLYSLIATAAAGRSSRDSLYLRTSAASDLLADACFTPVLDPVSGHIKHVLARFAPCEMIVLGGADSETTLPSPATCAGGPSPFSLDEHASPYLWGGGGGGGGGGDDDRCASSASPSPAAADLGGGASPLPTTPRPHSAGPMDVKGEEEAAAAAGPRPRPGHAAAAAASDHPYVRPDRGGVRPRPHGPRRPAGDRDAPKSSSPSPSSSSSSSQGGGATIFPRRKAGEKVRPGAALRGEGPIVVTLELLTSLEQFPLNKAAERIGLSATALKNACRKLGVRQWNYRRNRCQGGEPVDQWSKGPHGPPPSARRTGGQPLISERPPWDHVPHQRLTTIGQRLTTPWDPPKAPARQARPVGRTPPLTTPLPAGRTPPLTTPLTTRMGHGAANAAGPSKPTFHHHSTLDHLSTVDHQSTPQPASTGPEAAAALPLAAAAMAERNETAGRAGGGSRVPGACDDGGGGGGDDNVGGGVGLSSDRLCGRATLCT